METTEARRKGEWLELRVSRTPESAHAARLTLLAAGELPGKWLNRLYAAGGIRVGEGCIGLRVFADSELSAEPLYGRAAAAAGTLVPILHEDDYCLVLDKPAGMAVHPSGPAHGGTLDEQALRHMLRTGQRVRTRHIHRLDDDTSGPVLYSKNDLAQWKLDEAMRAKQIDRVYLALAHGRIGPNRGTIDRPIGRDRHHAARRRVSSSGDAATTHYEVVERYADTTLVRAWLETGRTHQLRVHFSSLGHPLVGDALYGGAPRQGIRAQALHGEVLRFPHPWSGARITVCAASPRWLAALSR
ncbi:RluA family pseudouridine synthase [Paenibacillus sp. IB182496]|uniref:Pseudouridine synthase n=1 Tax=Paenibacillus sabuli TaxID=2772509 RepID=A0A927BRL8_9BACL|nr:RluA family pseudouridine synthase [Paenibacillus sabuli]MBD2844626.1 RluA family pseudouridine synthase [Paenibacillus sabuli]